MTTEAWTTYQRENRRAAAACRYVRDREDGWCVVCHVRRRDKDQPRYRTCRKEKK